MITFTSVKLGFYVVDTFDNEFLTSGFYVVDTFDNEFLSSGFYVVDTFDNVSGKTTKIE